MYQGNSTDILAKVQDEVIDLTVCSPPYDTLRGYTEEVSWNWAIFHTIAEQLYRVTKPGGVVVWVVNDETVKGSETLTSFAQATLFKNLGFNMHDTMIWLKSNFANPSSNRYHQVFEYMFVLSKGKPKTFNGLKDRKNIYAGVIGSQGQNTVRQRDGSQKMRGKKINAEFGLRHNVWLLNTAGQNRDRYNGHPARFPVELARDHILTWSNPGEIVLDPFVGSGSTSAAAAMTDRRSIGIDVSKKYLHMATDPLQAALRK